MPDDDPAADDHPYVRGPATYRDPHATVETKPSSIDRYGSRDSGGGYVRIRSWEHDPTSARRGKEDVYAYVHRLCAVAWCYSESWSVARILADLDGMDIHHQSGVPWDNRADNLEVIDHAEHAGLSDAERRAYARDRKRDVQARESASLTGPDVCGACGSETDVAAESADWEGVRCLSCAKSESEGATIRL